MSDKNKNKSTGLTEFFRYLRDELKGTTRNSFERELQKDPFTAEAIEGFDMLSREDAEKDISELQRRLKNRIHHRGKVVFYRFAASIAILIALSLLFLLKDGIKTEQIAVNNERKEVLEIAKSQPITDKEANEMIADTPKPEAKKNDIPASGKAPVGKKQEEENIEISELAEQKNIDAAPDKNIKSAQKYSEPERMLAPASALASDRSKMESEDLVVEYENRKKSAKTAGTEDYSQPVPLTGKPEFDKYIKENMIRPDSMTGQTESVVISFLVKTDGTIDSLSIIESPGKAFSDEAIRLIKSGPAWKPGERDGRISDENVRLRLIFR